MRLEQTIDINGVDMHYREVGEGDPILFLHGAPMSSHVWRNIMPHLAPLGHCIAPDLIGFGHSAKPNIDYTLDDHINFIDQFIARLGLSKITLIVQGLGSIIGIHYAMQHEKNCKGLVFYEAFLRSLHDDDVSLPLHEHLISLQDQEIVHEIVTNPLNFVDKIIPQQVMRPLTDAELQLYREPFLASGSGKPIIEYLKALTTKEGDRSANKLIADYSLKLTQSTLPKLMLYSVPGFITTMATVMWAKEHIPHLEIVDIGEELHLAQESCPVLMGETISVWLQGIEA